jgi:hypothetical protein
MKCRSPRPTQRFRLFDINQIANQERPTLCQHQHREGRPPSFYHSTVTFFSDILTSTVPEKTHSKGCATRANITHSSLPVLSDFSLEYRGYLTSAWAAEAVGWPNLNVGKSKAQIWNGSWAGVDDKTLTRFIIETYKYKYGTTYQETNPHTHGVTKALDRSSDMHTFKILVLSSMLLVLPKSGTAEREAESITPQVVSLAIPYYPLTARAFHTEGTVHIELTTDGERVTATRAVDGPMPLRSFAENNAHTWIFVKHEPGRFRVTYRYSFTSHIKNNRGFGEILLRLPDEVEILSPPLAGGAP